MTSIIQQMNQPDFVEIELTDFRPDKKEGAIGTGDVDITECNDLQRLRTYLQALVVREWKIVWLGLYETCRRPHNDKLKDLWRGVRLFNHFEAEIRPLKWDFAEFRSNNGVATLKLFDGLSISVLHRVICLLQDYKAEIRSMDFLYSILKGNQLSFYQVVDFSNGLKMRNEYVTLRKQMEFRIARYNRQMNLLNEEILEEAAKLGSKNGRVQLHGKSVFEMVFS